WLDELVALSTDGNFVRHYLRMQALWFQIASVIAPFITVSPVRISRSQRAHIRPILPRDRRFAPLRVDARRAAALLRENPARRWTLEALAAEVHLSPSRLSSVFVEAYGKTPLAFLTMLRAVACERECQPTRCIAAPTVRSGSRNSLARQMWRAMTALGFDGGTVLEPGSGLGTFLGLAPETTRMTGAELDPVTAAISRA